MRVVRCSRSSAAIKLAATILAHVAVARSIRNAAERKGLQVLISFYPVAGAAGMLFSEANGRRFSTDSDVPMFAMWRTFVRAGTVLSALRNCGLSTWGGDN